MGSHREYPGPVSGWNSVDVPTMVGRRWREAFDLYRDRDPEQAGIRAHHLRTVVHITPWLMGANLTSGALLGSAIAASSPILYSVWSGLLLVLVALALRAWWRARAHAPRQASVRAAQRSTLHATALGLMWGAVPVLWLGDAPPPAQLVMGTLTTGMMAAGAFALSPLPKASIAWVVTLSVGAVVALFSTHHALALTLALLLLAYASICVIGAMAAGLQATALLRSERESVRQRELVRLLLQDFEEHASEALWELDGSGGLTHVSPRLSLWLERPAASLLGTPLLEHLRTLEAEGLSKLEEHLLSGRPFRQLLLHFGRGHQERWWELSGKPASGRSAQGQGWRGVAVDVTKEQQAQRRLVQLAHFDSVTGLANRVTLRERLGKIAAARTPAVLLSIDLDHFKGINDSFGHSIGDAVLKTVGQRLRSQVRGGDVVARMGGDEFAVLVEQALSREGAEALSHRILAAFEAPCQIEGRQLHVGLSIGAVLLPEHGENVEELMQRVDLALYEAKSTGRGRASSYRPELGERSRRRAAIERELHHAAARGELRLVWQPRVDLARWQVIGAEALLRWRHPELGEVGPAEFIPIAEKTGSIQSLGAWALEEACRAGISSLAEFPLVLSVNVSTLQLRVGGFEHAVEELLGRTGLPPGRLELELTESVFMDGAEATLASLRKIQGRGVRLALDDFGTGYSSMAYLRRFAFDTLKIDRSFVREAPDHADATALVQTMVSLARALGMTTVAEGIETTEQLDRLRQLGCSEIQGYLVSPPVPLPDLVQLLRGWSERPAGAPLH